MVITFFPELPGAMTMMLRPQLAFDADGGAKHGEAVAGAIIACVRKQLLETMAECGMDGAQADAALDVLLERTQILAAKARGN